MGTTPNLLLTHIAAAQNQKEVTANAAFDGLDGALTNVITEAMLGPNFTLPQADALGNMVFHFTGSLAVTGIVTLPASKKLYVVSNQTNQPLLFQSPGIGRTVFIRDSGVGSLLTTEYTLIYCDGTNVDAVAPRADAFQGDILARRILATQGALLAATDFVLSGWGSGASVVVAAGSTDTRGQITVTAGTGPSANPTMTLTFKNGTFGAAPFVLAKQEGGTQAPASITESSTPTTLVITFAGTPSSGNTVVITWICLG